MGEMVDDRNGDVNINPGDVCVIMQGNACKFVNVCVRLWGPTG